MKNIIEAAKKYFDIADKNSKEAEQAFIEYFNAIQKASEEDGRRARALLSVRSR